MKLFEGLYVYPWLSNRENNANTVFIDGQIPVLIDPGHGHLFNHVIEGMEKDGKGIDQVRLVICTHSHPDHIEAIDRMGEHTLSAISRVEYDFLHNGGKELFLMTGSRIPEKPFKLLLKEGPLNLGDVNLSVIPTPGHSPGSICLYWEEHRVLISGDTIFHMGMGRVDLPGGDPGLLGKSIEALSHLEVEYLIPGHGQAIHGQEVIKQNFRIILDQFF